MPCPYTFDALHTNYPREDRDALYRYPGHVDIVSAAATCGTACYFGSREGRFWVAAASP